MALASFLNKEEQERVVSAIADAERATSGEIRVHVEPKCKGGEPYTRAVEMFNGLKMFETAERNGVLIYVAYKSHHFAIIGDSGINEKVPEGFWDDEKDILGKHLSDGKQCEGLCEVIKMIGDNLSKYFPCQADDKNELSNEISYNS
jgi:Predicted membrane protein